MQVPELHLSGFRLPCRLLQLESWMVGALQLLPGCVAFAWLFGGLIPKKALSSVADVSFHSRMYDYELSPIYTPRILG